MPTRRTTSTQEPSPGLEKSLTHSTVRALRWNYLGSATRLVTSFGVNILLTRLLGPRPFGEIAVAILLYGLGSLIARIGITSALIQKATLDDRDIRFCFTIQMSIGVVVCLLLVVSAPEWALFFHQPELTKLLRILSPLFILDSFGTTPRALLNRVQNTRAIQFASVASYLVAYLGLAVPMALLGWGVWSLVAAYLVQAFISSSLLFAQKRHSLLPLLHRDGAPLFRFGLSVFGANLCNWGIINLDNTVVGRFCGPVALGFYSRAFTLASLPADTIVMNFQQVIFPAFSRVQRDDARLGRVYVASLGLLGLALIPPFCAMASVPSVIVLGLYGAKWAGATRLFQPLALALPVHALMAIAGPILASRGKPHKEMRLQLTVVFVAAIAYLASVHVSLLCLSWTVLLVYLLRFVLLTTSALREVGAKWIDVLRVLWPTAILALIATSVTKSLILLFPARGIWMTLLIVTTGSATLTIIAVILGKRVFLQPLLRRVPGVEEVLNARFAWILS